MKMLYNLIFFLFLSVIKADISVLQSVSDDELLELIRDKEKLVVLFSKENCKSCELFENQIESLQEDFKKHLNAPSVKAVSSHLARLYNPAKEPALVFFRHGVPLLYGGEPDENEIYGFFEKNQSPAVKELTDKIFEHITQAATGATTGDWFVMLSKSMPILSEDLFPEVVAKKRVSHYAGRSDEKKESQMLQSQTSEETVATSPPSSKKIKTPYQTKKKQVIKPGYGASCVECQRLHAVWEGVGATLRGRINVARMDANLAGVNTAKRFHVSKLPAFLFFRLGKVYRYELPKTDIKSFVTFAQDWYKNSKAEPVPLLASPFDDIVDWCVATLKIVIAFALELLAKYPWIWQIGVAGFGLVAITALIALVKAGRSRPVKETKKEKKRK